MTDKIEAIVVGAGVVGLAIARALALAGREVLVVEREKAIGTGISSRNSEVIHAGLYYPAGSLKTRLCIEGRRQLYAYCRANGIAHRPCSKLVVATDAGEVAKLDTLLAAARANGLTGDDALQPLDAAAAQRLEPALRCTAALLSPATGIVDGAALMLAYQVEAEAHGASVAFRTAFRRARRMATGFECDFDAAGETLTLACDILVNSAALHATEIARAIEGLPAAAIPDLHYVKGNYFTAPGRSAFSRLIYAVPVAKGLGIHVTLDLGGQMRFGPDTEDIDRIDYAVDQRRAAAFETAIRRYWPALPDGALQPAYSGIRPKLRPNADGFADFIIQDGKPFGLPGLVNLFGIESPGLTASLAIAAQVERLAAAL
jgi:L-2-hydroxyglutarate oxidase LhgO